MMLLFCGIAVVADVFTERTIELILILFNFIQYFVTEVSLENFVLF